MFKWGCCEFSIPQFYWIYNIEYPYTQWNELTHPLPSSTGYSRCAEPGSLSWLSSNIQIFTLWETSMVLISKWSAQIEFDDRCGDGRCPNFLVNCCDYSLERFIWSVFFFLTHQNLSVFKVWTLKRKKEKKKLGGKKNTKRKNGAAAFLRTNKLRPPRGPRQRQPCWPSHTPRRTWSTAQHCGLD